MLYHNYVETLSTRFEQAFMDIAVGTNLDFGEEFEIALCKVLRRALPQSFGIARGYVVTSDGQRAGDDIIIYERMRFPTLTARDEGFQSTEHIPVEAVLAYIEAKHTLRLDASNQGIAHALDQVSRVKSLIRTRRKRPLNLVDNVRFDDSMVTPPPDAPDHLNPPFVAICARRLQCMPDRVASFQVQESVNSLGMPDDLLPDIVAAGPEVIGLVVKRETAQNRQEYHLPFLIPDHDLSFGAVNHHALGMFLCVLMHGLSWIRLDGMPWPTIILDALKSDAMPLGSVGSE